MRKGELISNNFSEVIIEVYSHWKKTAANENWLSFKRMSFSGTTFAINKDAWFILSLFWWEKNLSLLLILKTSELTSAPVKLHAGAPPLNNYDYSPTEQNLLLKRGRKVFQNCYFLTTHIIKAGYFLIKT